MNNKTSIITIILYLFLPRVSASPPQVPGVRTEVSPMPQSEMPQPGLGQGAVGAAQANQAGVDAGESGRRLRLHRPVL